MKITLEDAKEMKRKCTNSTGTGFCNVNDDCLSYKHGFCQKVTKVHTLSDKQLQTVFNQYIIRKKLDKI